MAYDLARITHGSHLYGLATPSSDLDIYVVYDFHHKRYRPKKLTSQSINDESDTTRIYLERFTSLVVKGVPQALEALFARPNYWLYNDPIWPGVAEELKRLVATSLTSILETYKRTAMNFILQDNQKKNRHALRLLLNAQELKETAQFNPTLRDSEAKEITALSKLPWEIRQEEFRNRLFDCFG